MKISVITVVKNNERTIRDAIESTLAQKNIELEYIVIDGKSTDNTLNIIREYSERLAVMLSESDGGIYEALNRGVSLASGDMIAILHSDDVFASDTVLADVAERFKEGHNIVFGDLAIVRPDDISRTIRYWHSGKYSKFKTYFGWVPPHPSFFALRSFYENYGNFDTSFRISADYDLMLRFLTVEDAKPFYLKQLMVKMRGGGTSNNSIKNVFRKMSENYRVVKKHKLAGLFTVVMKKMVKVHQYLQFDNLKK